MKAVFTIATDDLNAKAYDKMQKPQKVTYPTKGSEDALLVSIIKRILAET